MAVDEQDIPENGAVFSFGKSRFADNLPSKFWIRNDTILQISCGDEHTAVVTESGRLFIFGSNDWGQLGQGYPKAAERPMCIKGLKTERVKKVACGKNHTIVSTESGRLYGFGNNTDGQLGQNHPKDLPKPVLITDLATSVECLSCGVEESIVLTSDGSLFLFGNNWNKCLTNDSQEKTTPLKLTLEFPIISLSCGYYHTTFVTSEGKLYVLGEKEREKMMLYKDPRQAIEAVSGIPEKAIKVSCGGNHTAVLTVNGKLYTFGNGANGQLGLGNRILESDSPQLVSALEKFKLKDVECGESHTSVITENGTLFIFGDGRHGKLGLGNENFSNQFWPKKVTSFTNFVVEQISCGGCHTMVLAKLRTEKEIELFGSEDVDSLLTSVRGSIEDVRRNRKDSSSNLKLPPLKLPGKSVEKIDDFSAEKQPSSTIVLVEESPKPTQKSIGEPSVKNVEKEEKIGFADMQNEINSADADNRTENSDLLMAQGKAGLDNSLEPSSLKTDDDSISQAEDVLSENSISEELDESALEEELDSVPDEVIAFMNTQINVLPASSPATDEMESENDVVYYDESSKGETNANPTPSTEELEEANVISQKNSVENDRRKSKNTDGTSASAAGSEKSVNVSESDGEEDESEIEESEETSTNANYANSISKKDLEEASNSKSPSAGHVNEINKKKRRGSQIFNRLFGVPLLKEKSIDEPAPDISAKTLQTEEKSIMPNPLPPDRKEPVLVAPQSTFLCTSARKTKLGEEESEKTVNKNIATKQSQSIACVTM